MAFFGISHSQKGIPIRITHERWTHITESHDYMAGNMDLVLATIEDPDYIVSGEKDEQIALKLYPETSLGEKHVAVVYKEEGPDGFIITAFMTSKAEKLLKKGIKWQKSKIS